MSLSGQYDLPDGDVPPEHVVRLVRSVNRYDRLIKVGAPLIILENEADLLARRARDVRDWCNMLIALHGKDTS